jgi:uncharacterized membrane protein YphA (DoxX/SURF4 family)
MTGSHLKKLLTSKYLAFAFRLALGGFFIYASMSKIPYPAQFAEATANYRLVPHWLVHPVAVVLPWLEFVCGLFLVIGFSSRAAVVLIGMLLIIFNVMVLINIYWGAPISCGCYDTVGEPISWKKILENLVFLLFAVHIYYFDRIFIFHRGGRTDPSKITVPTRPVSS